MSLSTAPRARSAARTLHRPDARPAAPVAHPISPVSVRTPSAPAAPTGRRRRRPPAELRITLPRTAALTVGGLAFGGATAALAVTGLAELASVAVFPLLLPVLLAAAVVGVARLESWAPLAWQEWRGPLGYASVAPWAVLQFAVAAVPELALPWWLPPAAGLLVAAPFLWSAVGPARLRPRLRPRPDAHGRRGAVLAGVALSVLTLSVARPGPGVFGVAALTVLFAVAALAPRGLADAGATWSGKHWAALTWGAWVAWAAGPLAAGVPAFAHPAGLAGLVLAAGAPLLVVGRR
nr:hypothetical protein [Propionibacterium sp.]